MIQVSPPDPKNLVGERDPSFVGTALVCLVFLTIAYASWARGGTRPELQLPLLIAGALLLFALLILPLLCATGKDATENRFAAIRPILTDRIAWAGLAFMALLTVQWWNSGRQLVLDGATSRWVYSLPPYPGWPSAFTSFEAAEMLAWFLPAWAIALAARSPWMNRRRVWALFFAFAANAGVLAAFGTVQFLSGTKSIFWTFPAVDPFFASFGYVNHGSTFFFLATSLTVALLVRECFGRHRRPRRWAIAALLAALILNMIGTHLSLCRAGIAFAWILTFVAGVYALRRARRDMPPAVRAYLALSIVAVVLLAVLAIASIADREIESEIAGKIVIGYSLRDYFAEFIVSRGGALSVCWDIWKDNLWFGTGGWGFAHLFGLYVPQPLWSRVAGGGRANVHNDPLQFLAEFGLVGGLLLAFAVVVLAIAIVRSGVWRRGAAIMVLTGCSMVWLQSLIDIPFRCPAILFSWTFLLAALPALSVASERERDAASSPATELTQTKTDKEVAWA